MFGALGAVQGISLAVLCAIELTLEVGFSLLKFYVIIILAWYITVAKHNP